MFRKRALVFNMNYNTAVLKANDEWITFLNAKEK